MSAVVPGQKIGIISKNKSGKGTYIKKNIIYASVVGTLINQNGLLEVQNGKQTIVIPEVESVVIGKITKITPMHALLDILVVNDQPVSQTFRGIIRKQDIRQFEKDKIQLFKCFRPGDIVRSQVLSLGDSKSYYLSTDKNHLGVLFAQSEAGSPMVPISWEQMQCTKTKQVEYRKCAKPDSLQ